MFLSSFKTLTTFLTLTIAVASLAIVTNLPTETVYSPFNTGLKGISGIVSSVNVVITYGLSDVPKGFKGSVLLPLKSELSLSDYGVINELVGGGANLVIVDELGYSNELLKYLGIDAVVVSGVVLDEISKYLSRYYPLVKLSLGGKSYELVTYRPAYVSVGGGYYSAIGTTSNYSYVDVDGDGYYSVGEVMKSYVIICRTYLGNGSLTLISDADILSNELLSINSLAIKELVSSPTYLVVGYLGLGGVDFLKYLLTKLPVVRYCGDLTSLITSYVLVTTFSYISYYLSFNGFSRRGLRPYLLSTTYLVVVAVYDALVIGDPLVITPSLINLVVCVTKPEFRSPSTLTTLIYYSLISTELITYLAPLYVLTPYLVSTKLDTSLNNFLGPTTTNFIKYLLIMTVTALVSVNSLMIVSLMIVASLINCLIYYVRLTGIRVELLEVPSEVLIKSSASVLLNTYSKSLAYLTVVSSDGFREVFRLSGYSIIKYPIPTQHLGNHSLLINLVLTDSSGFSRRLLRPVSVRYVVIPATFKVLESIRSEVFSRRDIKDLLGDVELSIVELGSGSVGFGRDEVSRIIRGLSSRGGLGRFSVEFLSSLTEFGREVSEGLGRRGRVGDYVGVRYYVPGDEFRSIHWSKSLSKASIVVKEFVTPSSYEGLVVSSGLEPIVIVDLTASDVRDFDNILFTLLNTFLSVVRVGLGVETSLVVVSGDVVLVMSGKALDILYRLYRTLSNLMPKLIYDYDPIKSRVSSDYVKYLIANLGNVRYFSKLVSVSKYFTRDLVKALVVNGLTPPKPYTVIHSEALNVRYALVRYELSSYGYLDVELSRLASYIALGGVK